MHLRSSDQVEIEMTTTQPHCTKHNSQPGKAAEHQKYTPCQHGNLPSPRDQNKTTHQPSKPPEPHNNTKYPRPASRPSQSPSPEPQSQPVRSSNTSMRRSHFRENRRHDTRVLRVCSSHCRRRRRRTLTLVIETRSQPVQSGFGRICSRRRRRRRSRSGMTWTRRACA